jgi:drug/metabolite transporter (DMT)-like permease
MILAALLTATGQLFWKLGFTNFYLMLLGFICYGGGALLMIKSFSLEKLSVAYPLMCTSYIFALIFGDLFLEERITYTKIFAITLLIFGVILTSHEN